MASQPQYATAVVVGSALIGSAETNLQVPTQASLVVTGGTNGTKVEEIVVTATSTSLIATTVAGLVYLFIYNGTNYRLFDTVTVTANTASSTAAPFRASRPYNNLVFPSGSFLYASQSVSGNASIMTVTALGANF